MSLTNGPTAVFQPPAWLPCAIQHCFEGDAAGRAGPSGKASGSYCPRGGIQRVFQRAVEKDAGRYHRADEANVIKEKAYRGRDTLFCRQETRQWWMACSRMSGSIGLSRWMSMPAWREACLSASSELADKAISGMWRIALASCQPFMCGI